MYKVIILAVLIGSCVLSGTYWVNQNNVTTIEIPTILQVEKSQLDIAIENTRKIVQAQLEREADLLRAVEVRDKAQSLVDDVRVEFELGLESVSLYGGGAMGLYSELSVYRK